MVECAATTAIANKHGIPSVPIFLANYLLHRTGTELSGLAVDIFAVLDARVNRSGTARQRLPQHLPDPTVPSRILPQAQYTLRFDGSFYSPSSAGIGIALAFDDSPPFAKFSVPVTVGDA